MNVKKGYIKVPYVRLNKIFHLKSFHWTFIPDSDVSKFQIFVKIRYLKKFGCKTCRASVCRAFEVIWAVQTLIFMMTGDRKSSIPIIRPIKRIKMNSYNPDKWDVPSGRYRILDYDYQINLTATYRTTSLEIL